MDGGAGKQKCGMNCQWEAACVCNGKAPTGVKCGNCGTWQYACDEQKGKWVETKCVGEPLNACEPGKPVKCGSGGTGTQDCDSSCQPTGKCNCPANACGPDCVLCDKAGPGQTATCNASGQCEYKCAGGTTDCGGKCVDLNGDDSNCRECGKVCGTSQSCSANGCQCDDKSLQLCGTNCCKSTESCSSANVCVPKNDGTGGTGGAGGVGGGSPTTPPKPDGGSGGGSPTTPPKPDGGSGGGSPTTPPKAGNGGGSGGSKPTGGAGGG
jgi:hypothetical protein